MLSRVALPVLMWSISAAGGEEPPADQPVIELEVVTVTATKTERSAFEVPASVSIVGPERIESDVDEARIVTTIDGARQNFNLGHQGRFFIDPGLLKQVEVYSGLRVDFKVSVSYWF